MAFEYTPTANTQALWRFNGNLLDSSGQGRNLTKPLGYERYTFQTGLLGQCLSTGGSNLTLSGTVPLSPGPYTFSVWFQTGVDPSFWAVGPLSKNSPLFKIEIENFPTGIWSERLKFYPEDIPDRHIPIPVNDYGWGIQSSNGFLYHNTPGEEGHVNTDVSAYAGCALSLNTWHLLTTTYDGSIILVYADGVLVSTLPKEGTSLSHVPDRLASIPGTPILNITIANFSSFFLDETLIENVAWDPAKISNYYSGTG